VGTLAEIGDFRRAQGRKRSIRTVPTICVTAQHARALKQRVLRRLRCRRNPRSGRFKPPSQSTIQRLLAEIGPEVLQRTVARQMERLTLADAPVASDGKRIRGTKRHAPDGRRETVTRSPMASAASQPQIRGRGRRAGHDAGASDKTGIPSRAVTLDALHTTKKPDAALVEDRGASCFPTVKGNRPTLHAELEAVDREAESIGRHREELSAAHGRIGSRWIAVIGDPALLQAFPGCRQAFRVTRFHRTAGTGKADTTVACGVTSLSPGKVDPGDLSKLNRGRRVIKTRNRCRRDTDFGEDASRMRTGHGTVYQAVEKPLGQTKMRL